MSQPARIHLGSLASALIVIGLLVYSFVISDMIPAEMRAFADQVLSYGLCLGYAFWVAGVVFCNSVIYNGIIRRSYTGNRGLAAGFSIWRQTLTGATRASIIAPIMAHRLSGKKGSILSRLLALPDLYVARPLLAIVWVVVYALLSALLIIPQGLLCGAPKEKPNADPTGIQDITVVCIAGSSSTRQALLKALISSLEICSTAPWFVLGTPRIAVSRNLPRYQYADILLTRKKNNKIPSHNLKVYDAEGSEKASITTLDALPYFQQQRGALLVVEEDTTPAEFAHAFDTWYELMRTAHKNHLARMKCAVIIRPAAGAPILEGACELSAGADKSTCLRFLRERQMVDVMQKAALFPNTAFFAISSSLSDLPQCPGIHSATKWLIQETTRR